MEKAKKFLAVVLCLSVLAVCSVSAAVAEASSYVPGTYQGAGTGMGAVIANVTVDADSITEIVLDLSNETENIGQVAGDTLVDQLLLSQSTEIDGVSGATITTNAVKDAVNAALSQARGETASTVADGVYTGTGRGSRSNIVANVTIEGGAITGIEVTESGDSPYVSEVAIKGVSSRIIEKQSVAVDSVTGATLTSAGVKAAVADALTSAGANLMDWSASEAKEKAQGETVDVDVVVVGGGASGLMAALAAKTDRNLSETDSGLNVLVVESNGYGGGNMTLCGGFISSYFGTPLNEASGVSMDTDAVVDALEAALPSMRMW